jgi:hypothetical protein
MFKPAVLPCRVQWKDYKICILQIFYMDNNFFVLIIFPPRAKQKALMFFSVCGSSLRRLGEEPQASSLRFLEVRCCPHIQTSLIEDLIRQHPSLQVEVNIIIKKY